ncbi:IclR family transcriptional regulator domain-containing protein [Roseomonas marmotae]|uniref:Helix-turn-helix domain-containing protein n=1 Tax=Roseomonas marmotae TaxID=2768161 RepID=A0ABS3KJN7_9PROT|nr:IclR family transcriptional regulator C-terminal domain-containing protein [Roseomonas marmotae]MBO1076551.1 helix-turn-helix domain-containing protein [Roseomonas marmotae]QTI81834.1 helix-turn-helix domain-containing protein [Roseomonas marmotae]
MRTLPEKPETIGSLARGLSVIEAFSPLRPKASIADIARATGLTRAAARRCLLTLQELGYAEFDGKFFTLTPRVLRLGGAYLSSTPLPEILQPELEAVREAVQESCSAAILDGPDVIYVARSAARRIMSVSLGVGSRLPAHCTSLGRALLSTLPEARLEAFLARLPPGTATEHTRAAVATARAAGYALVNEELEPGLRSVAMPVRDMRGRCVAAINIGAHAGRATDEVVEELFLPALRRAVARLAERIPG